MIILTAALVSAGLEAPDNTVKRYGAGSSGTGKLYGTGSIGKVVTSAAVMKLADEGKINLDAPLTGYIPEFTMADPRYAQITPRMLLNHSSGLMGSTFNNAFMYGDNDTWSRDHILEMLADQTLKHAPGERSIYCNDGFTLAEIMVERVGGMSFTDYLETGIFTPLGLENFKTPQSVFDRNMLASIYIGNNELKPESYGIIGSGGMYATAEDLCRLSAIFMDSADGSYISKKSVDEMAKKQHKKDMASEVSDTAFRFGLGWDTVDAYPFNRLGIKALGKGGSTISYTAYLEVIPEYNLAAAVMTSGGGGCEQLIAQEIILAVLREEGLIPDDFTVTLPEQNLERMKVPDETKLYAGVYESLLIGLINIEFTEDSLIMTPIMAKNEHPMEFIYNTDGYFVSENGDFIGLNPPLEGTRGISSLSFAEDKYLLAHTYESIQGLSINSMAFSAAEKIGLNPVRKSDQEAWDARNGDEYLLVSEKYTSANYIGAPMAKTLTDSRVPGYAGQGVYRGAGMKIRSVKIIDGDTATGFQDAPAMSGRDTNNLCFINKNGAEYLNVNNYRFVNSSAAKKFSEINGSISIDSETVWVDIGEGPGGQSIFIETPQNGAWFVYDEKMNCVASSLEKNLRDKIILPDNGRLAFAGEAGAEFVLK